MMIGNQTILGEPMDLNELAERLQRAEDRLALYEVEGAYARAFDAREGDAWAALFVDDGIYQSRGGSPGNGTFVQGRDALARFCREATFSGIHFMHQPQITLDGDTAQSRVHLEFIGAFDEPGSPVTRMLGYYDVRYRRVDGRWLIVQRITSTFARHSDVTFGYPTGTGFDAT
jgi:ketosteroid isomerase-like protein